MTTNDNHSTPMQAGLDKARGMNEPKWTPGPWRVETSGRGSLCVASDDAWICGELDNQPHEMRTSEAEANAHLIAAVPELYEALQNVIREADRKTDAFNRARAALAKARGES